MNVVFLSPHFPPNFWLFARALHEQGARVGGVDRVEQSREIAPPAASRADPGDIVDTDRNQHHVDAFVRRLLREQLRDLACPQAAGAGGPPMDLAVAVAGQRGRGASEQRVLQDVDPHAGDDRIAEPEQVQFRTAANHASCRPGGGRRAQRGAAQAQALPGNGREQRVERGALAPRARHGRYFNRPIRRPTRVKASIARSRCARVCAALIWVRMRAWPLATTG